MTSAGRLCKARNARGEPCAAYAVAGSRFCFWHDPQKEQERKLARVRGGLARQGRSGIVQDRQGVLIPLRNLSDVVQLVEQTVGDLLTLENSVSRARAVGYLCGVAVKALEASELEERITRLEEQLEV